MSSTQPEALETSQSRRFKSLSPSDAAEQLRNRWQLATSLVDVVLSAVENGEIAQEDVYPLIPHTITSVVTGIYGFVPRNGFVEAETLTKAEAIAGAPILAGMRS